MASKPDSTNQEAVTEEEPFLETQKDGLAGIHLRNAMIACVIDIA